MTEWNNSTAGPADYRALDDAIEQILADGEISPDEIPRIDLYMDQIITIFEERLSRNKRDPEDKLLTKTMIHNYSKEKLIQPLKGKKYSREHILQILLIYQMKQTLSIQDIKNVLIDQPVEVYRRFLDEKQDIRDAAREFALRFAGDFVKTETPVSRGNPTSSGSSHIPHASDPEETEGLSDKEARLLAVLNLTAMSNYMKRMAEELIDRDVDREKGERR